MKPYQPEQLPIEGLDFSRIITLVGDANAALAKYDGLLQGIPNPEILLSPLVRQEAVFSSRIEGTQATLTDVLEHEAGKEHDEETRRDVQEIMNYRRALLLGKKETEERPIRLSLVRALHHELMRSVRGEHMDPGQFRKDQNWIGPQGSDMTQATYVPPNPVYMQDNLENWERYLQKDDFDRLTQAGIMHAQFELIHPFRDGNGRIGRLLIPLFLYRIGRLSGPMFYLSEFLEQHRTEYYDRLLSISQKGDWIGWLQFFLRGVTKQAQQNVKRVNTISKFHQDMLDQLKDLTHSRHYPALLNALFEHPIFQVKQIAEFGIPVPTAHQLVKMLLREKLIWAVREPAGRRPAIYAFPSLLNLAADRQVIPEL